MNLLNFYRSVAISTGPFAATPSAALAVPLKLSGPFILGIQILTSDRLDTAFRLVTGGAQLFPDPVSQVVSQAGLAPGDRWYRPASDAMVPVRIVVPGEGGLPNATFELANADAAAAADVFVSLIVAARPPDAMTLELLNEMRQGLDRFPDTARELFKEFASTYLERQSLPR